MQCNFAKLLSPLVKFKTNILLCIAVLCTNYFLCVQSLYAQTSNNYLRLVDSADVHIDESSQKALAFLDSIPLPVENYIEGKVADYYVLKGLIHDDYNESAKVYQNYILAYKYAEKEKNYITAGEVCLELFASVYFSKRDSTAYKYLNKAKVLFEKANYKNGLIEVDQMEPYIKFIDGEFESCNNLILEKIDSYRNVESSSYYEMFANYMLISNYIYIDDLDKAHIYYKDFDKFKTDTTVAKYNYLSFKSTIDLCFSDVFMQRKDLDSVEYYIKKCSKYKTYLGSDSVEDYYGIYSNFYKQKGNIEISKSYLDSLRIFQDKMYKNIVDVSFSVNEELLKVENELNLSKNNVVFERFWIIILTIGVFILIVVVSKKNRKVKIKEGEFDKNKDEITTLKSNQEKLKLKVHSLEEYINEFKKEIKVISSINEIDEQRKRIKELYKNVHLGSSTILSKENSHLDLIKELNMEFFDRISLSFPRLSDSEKIICYYLFSEFKSKEIAVFLNTSTRAIESKRYRINKKLKTSESNFSLYNFLLENFGDLKSS